MSVESLVFILCLIILKYPSIRFVLSRANTFSFMLPTRFNTWRIVNAFDLVGVFGCIRVRSRFLIVVSPGKRGWQMKGSIFEGKNEHFALRRARENADRFDSWNRSSVFMNVSSEDGVREYLILQNEERSVDLGPVFRKIFLPI